VKQNGADTVSKETPKQDLLEPRKKNKHEKALNQACKLYKKIKRIRRVPPRDQNDRVAGRA